MMTPDEKELQREAIVKLGLVKQDPDLAWAVKHVQLEVDDWKRFENMTDDEQDQLRKERKKMYDELKGKNFGLNFNYSSN